MHAESCCTLVSTKRTLSDSRKLLFWDLLTALTWGGDIPIDLSLLLLFCQGLMMLQSSHLETTKEVVPCTEGSVVFIIKVMGHQRSCGCPSPGNVPGQAGWGLSMGMGVKWQGVRWAELYGPFHPKPFSE